LCKTRVLESPLIPMHILLAFCLLIWTFWLSIAEINAKIKLLTCRGYFRYSHHPWAWEWLPRDPREFRKAMADTIVTIFKPYKSEWEDKKHTCTFGNRFHSNKSLTFRCNYLSSQIESTRSCQKRFVDWCKIGHHMFNRGQKKIVELSNFTEASSNYEDSPWASRCIYLIVDHLLAQVGSIIPHSMEVVNA
jgi:hypothetical protein